MAPYYLDDCGQCDTVQTRLIHGTQTPDHPSWSRATDMNCHIPYKIRDINDKVIFEKRQIHTVLSIFFEDCLSGPTRTDLSQSIKNPPSSGIMMFSVLISRCRMFASKYAASWAIKWDMSTLDKHGQKQTNLAWHLQWQ